MNVLEGTLKGQRDRIVATAHQTALLSRQPKLKDLKHYLKAARPTSPDADGAAVLAMARRLKARQDNQQEG